MNHGPKNLQSLVENQIPIVLIGLPGSGKTTISADLAQRLGWERIDLDDAIVERCQMDIPQIFSLYGEATFRELEYQAAAGVLESGAGLVVGSGGGAPTFPATKEILEKAFTVYLEVSPQCAAGRVKTAAGRPLLAATQGVEERMCYLYAQRHQLYLDTATVVVDGSGSETQVVDQILTQVENYDFSSLLSVRKGLDHNGEPLHSRPQQRHYPPDPDTDLPPAQNQTWRIPVSGRDDYTVVVGRNLLAELSESFHPQTKQILLVYPASVSTFANEIELKLHQCGYEIVPFVHPDGEEAKTYRVVEEAWQLLGDKRFSRRDAVVCFGGGVTTDLGGFIASTWLRGIDVVNVPSTLLGMVDAAIGGKTGINTDHGKNLVGAFYPPRAVFCDLNYLQTLRQEDIRSGLGEVVKCGFIRDGKILDLIAQDQGGQARDMSSEVIGELVARSVAVKAKVVSQDLREGGIREILNYGHTMGHAIERADEFSWRHGDAVAVGMVYAATLAEKLGLAPAGWADTHRKYLNYLGLPTSYGGTAWGFLYYYLSADKKVRLRIPRFVLPKPDHSIEVLPLTNQKLLEQTFFEAICPTDD